MMCDEQSLAFKELIMPKFKSKIPSSVLGMICLQVTLQHIWSHK